MRALLLLAVVAGTAQAAEIAPGVHVIEHPDATQDWPHGNTTIVIGERAVLVVDSTYLPSAARADIAAIRRLTKKPVRWLVNTHWHYDHIHGNREYQAAFPGVDIVAHEETARLIAQNGPRYLRARVAAGSPARQALAELEARKDPALAAEIARRKNELAELGKAPYLAPTATFSDRLVVDLGGRTVEILHLGRGNTPGDAVVWLPAEKIVVTGDLLVAPVPYCWNSSPRPWIATLRRVRGLGAAIVVPGHGPVMRDFGHLDQVVALLVAVTDQVGAAAAAGKTLDEARAAVKLDDFRARMVTSDPVSDEVWRESVVKALIERAFLEARGSL